MIPPRVNLALYDTVGIIELSSNAKGSLGQFATQTLMEEIQSAQPGVLILELGVEDQVLGSVGHDRLNWEAIKALGQTFEIGAILVGRLQVTDVKPNVRVSTSLTSLSAQADVEARLSLRLLETGTGATVWTGTARRKERVAHLDVISRGPADFGASDVDSAYARLAESLAREVASDFQPRYELR
jgi:hypothetical protein